MERAGLVRRTHDPNDRRVWLVQLTRAGTELERELKLQESGGTDRATQLKLGKLLNAQQLLLGRLSTTARLTTIALRLLDVETGAVSGTSELECRDCELGDYYEGLTRLVDDWAE